MGTFTKLFGKSPRVAVVEAFAENPDEELSVPEIVRISGVSRRAAYMHVRLLLSEGIIKKHRKLGKCWYYTFNENDPRGEALTYLDSALALGFLEQEIKRDEGLSPEAQLPPYIKRRPDWRMVPSDKLSPSTFIDFQKELLYPESDFLEDIYSSNLKTEIIANESIGAN